MNLNQILFATDFSEHDLRAFHESCQLALSWDAKLNILHARDPREIVKPRAKQKDPSKEFLRFVPDDLAINFEHILQDGEPADLILNFANGNDVDLIVLGTHGRTGMNRIFGGSVAETVLRKSPCPVMTLRDVSTRPTISNLKQILVPVDFSVYGYAAVHFASELASTTDASLTICYVDDSDDSTPGSLEAEQHQKELWANLKRFFPTNNQVRFNHKLFKGEPGKKICDCANNKGYDYVVLGTHGRTGLGRALLGSVAEYVVRHSACPVITVKPSDRRSKLTAAS